MLKELSDHIAYCHERARKCALQAERTADPRTQQAYLASERRWLMLATSYQVSGRSRACAGAQQTTALPKSAPPPLGVPRVMCPDCGGRMHLRLVTPHPNKKRRETSTFECACGHLYQQTVGRPRVRLGLAPALPGTP